MAQATKSSSRHSGSSSRNGSSSKASSSSRGRSSNGSQKQRKAERSSTIRKVNRRGAAKVARARRARRRRVAQIASKAKTPLVAAGAVLAGIAGGLAMRSQNHKSRNPLKKMSAPSIDLSKIDLDSLTSAAQRVGKIGQQVGDVAEAADKARKKHK